LVPVTFEEAVAALHGWVDAAETIRVSVEVNGVVVVSSGGVLNAPFVWEEGDDPDYRSSLMLAERQFAPTEVFKWGSGFIFIYSPSRGRFRSGPVVRVVVHPDADPNPPEH
jgi:hypothetical protein